MPETPEQPQRRDAHSCLTGGQEGNLGIGPLGSGPPQQPTGPTHPGGPFRSTRFRWLPRPPKPEPDDDED